MSLTTFELSTTVISTSNHDNIMNVRIRRADLKTKDEEQRTKRLKRTRQKAQVSKQFHPSDTTKFADVLPEHFVHFVIMQSHPKSRQRVSAQSPGRRWQPNSEFEKAKRH